MSENKASIAQDIDAYLQQHEHKDMLRFLTCGSVDDGKSTLIGRLLYDSKMIYEDQLAAVKQDSEVHGTTGDDFDPALLTDGLKAEREQGITIDVAYRYFSTDKRNFIIADTPGHEQYTRNMATGASTCNLAVILIDARHGVLPQTRRHSFIASLLGIRHLVVAVNKMDLVDYDEAVYEEIRDDFTGFAAKLEVSDVHFIPMSALKGDNVVDRSENMPWYRGVPFLEYLETVYVASDNNLIDLRFPVQYVLRPDLDYRGYCGTVASGIIRRGDKVLALPSRQVTRVKALQTFDGDVDEAFSPMAVTVTLEDEIDVSRGDMIVHQHNLPRMERRVEAMMVWMGDEPLDPAKPYFVKQTTQVTQARFDDIRYQVDINTLKKKDADTLALNEIGRVVLTTHRPLLHDAYSKNRSTGCFVVVDSMTNNTVAAGMIIEREPSDQLPRRMASSSDRADVLDVRKGLIAGEERVRQYGQRPVTVWLTGLPRAGKAETARVLERRLFDLGAFCVVLDSGSIRLGVSRDLDYTEEERTEHLRRVAEMARLLNNAGQMVICAFVSPLDHTRKQVREIIGEDRFCEVYVNTPLAVCEARDPKGVYKRAHDGELTNVPGINAVYEAPVDPDLKVSLENHDAEDAAGVIQELLRVRGIFPARDDQEA